MKRYLLFGFLSLAMLASGDDLARHFSVDAREVAAARGVQDIWRTSWGSGEREIHGTKLMEISVHNLGFQPATAEVIIEFLSGGVVIGHATKTFEFHNERELKARIYAPETRSTETDLNAIHYHSTTGTSPIERWFVVGRVNGTIFGWKASDHTTTEALEKVIKAGTFRWEG